MARKRSDKIGMNSILPDAPASFVATVVLRITSNNALNSERARKRVLQAMVRSVS